MDRLIAGNSYLIRKDLFNSEIKKVKIIEVTLLCYQIQFENDVKEWFLISEFEEDYIIIENLNIE